jgi:phage terminase large subunit GpA-like protein
MPYTEDERREYNKKYYTENKKRIADMLLAKIQCPHCKKMITKSNLERHTQSDICARRKEKLSQPSTVDLNDLQKQINELKSLINKS